MSDQERKVQLGFAVNTSEARQGFEEVSKAGEAMADRLSKSGAKAAKGVKGAAEGAEEAVEKLSRSQRAWLNDLQRSQALEEAGGKRTVAYYEALARLRGESFEPLRPYIAQLDAGKVKQDQATRSLGNMEMSAKQTAAALRQVPMQFSDIAVSLASGQAPLTVLLQQGAQLKDSFGGVGAAARAMGGYVLGLVNPYTVAAAAVGGLALAYEGGRAEMAAFNKDLILSGNAVGASADQLMSMAMAISEVNDNISRSRAAEVLGAIASTGRVGVDQLERFTVAAAEFERVGGGSIESVKKAIEDLAKDPLGATLRLNEGMNYLTQSVLDQIKSLEDQGKTLEASKVALDAFFDAVEQRTPRLEANLSVWERAFGAVRRTVAALWSDVKSIGVPETLDQQIARRQSEISAYETTQPGRRTTAMVSSIRELGGIDAAKASLDALREQQRLLSSAADQERQRGQLVKARIELDKIAPLEAEKALKKTAEINRVRELSLRLGESEEQTRKRIAAIEEKYAEKVAKTRSARGADPFASERVAAQSWADSLQKFTDLAGKAKAKTLGLSEAQRELLEYLESPGYTNMSESARQRALQEAYAAIAAEQTAEAFKREQDALQDLMKAEEDRVRAQQRSAAGVEGQLQKLLDEEQALAIAAASNISLAQAIEQVAIARLREAQAKELSFGNEGLAAEIQREIDAREKLRDAIGRGEQREAVKKQAEDAQKEWERTAQSIEQSLTDALLRGFESGKSMAENLKDVLVNSFKTLVLRPLIQPMVSGMAGGIMNLFGGGGGSLGGVASSVFGGGGGGGFLGSLGTLGGGLGSGFQAGFGALLNGGGIEAVTTGISAALNGGSLASAAGGIGTALGAALPVAGILAGVSSLLEKKIVGRGYGVYVDQGMFGSAYDWTERKGQIGGGKTSVRDGSTDPAALAFVQQARAVSESATAMASALGLTADGVEKYTGVLRVNLEGADSAEEAQRRINQSMDDLRFSMLRGAEGFDFTRAEFGKLMDGVRSSMESVGITSESIADVIIQGMTGRLQASQVGQQLSDIVIGGVYESIASSYAGQIAGAFTNQIITPLFTAIAAGVPVSQAISQQAIASVVSSAQQAAAQLNAVFSDPGFRAAIAGVQEAISGIAGAATSVQAPAFRAATSSYNQAAEAAKRAAEETKRAWQSIADSITDEIRRIRGELVPDTSMGQGYYMAQFEAATRRARGGDQEAAGMLPELSQAVLDIANATAGSLSELQFVQTSTLASLAQTRKILRQQYGVQIPAFAEGGLHSGGVRLVGERGAELEVTGPARYYSAEQTQRMLGSDPELRKQIQALAEAMNRLADSNGQIETHTRQTRAILDRVSQGGDAILMVNA